MNEKGKKMPPEKQWMLTKMVGVALGMVTLISICIGGANVLFEVKNDVYRVEANVAEYKVISTREDDRISADVSKNRDAIHAIEIQNARVETNQKEIIRKLDMIIDNKRVQEDR